MQASVFIPSEDVKLLTGKTRRALQIARLREMGIPFIVSAAGYPLVARSVIDGTKTDTRVEWEPRVV